MLNLKCCFKLKEAVSKVLCVLVCLIELSFPAVRFGRRELIAVSVIAPWVSMVNQTPPSCKQPFFWMFSILFLPANAV